MTINLIDWEKSIISIAERNRKLNRPKLADAYTRLGYSEDALWIRQAIRCVDYLIRRMPEIAADDVWESMETYTAPNNPRSMGLVFKICHKSQIIKPTARYRKTRRKQANGRDIRIWEAFE